MKIDEAIAHAREVADINSDCWKHCNRTDNDCYICEEEHEQLVEWLEELKSIKDGSIPIIHGKAELELHDREIRNKAIDEFCKALLSNPVVDKSVIKRVAEQLKAGGSIGNL